MANANELMEMSSALSSGFVADRALLALQIHGPGELTDEDRLVLRDSAQMLDALFLEEPTELVSTGKVAYLASAQADWYETLTESYEEADAESEKRFRAYVQDAVETATALAVRSEFTDTSVAELERLLAALSKVTREHVDTMRVRMRPMGGSWRHQTIVE